MAKPKLFGFWLPVADALSAGEAVKMAGLPVLIMGANADLVALLALMPPDADAIFAAGAGVIAALLIIVAFQMRSGGAAWVPATVLLFAGFFILNIVVSLTDAALAGASYLLVIVTTWIVPVFAGALALSGLRGWFWMRNNHIPRRF